ncbi:hypothetical protein Tco_1515191 [Tanacetum coccineum]
MTEGNKKQYIANVKVMNYLLQAIPNDIYNSVDACKNAKDMWERIKQLMFGSDVTSHVRHSRLMDEFDKFAAKEGESLESVYEILTTLVNIMDRGTVSYDQLYDSLIQFEPHVLASKARKAAKNHDPLALFAHSNASSMMHALSDENADSEPSYDAKAVSEVNASNKVHEQVNHAKCKTIINTSDDDQIDSNIIFDDPYVENNGGNFGGCRRKLIENEKKMVELDYGKLNALYEIFVPQQEPSAEQTYFSIPSTSNHSFETKETTSDLPIQKMLKESKLLKMFGKMSLAIHDLLKQIDVTLLDDRERRWMSDSQNSLREFYKSDVLLMSDSLSINLKYLQQ